MVAVRSKSLTRFVETLQSSGLRADPRRVRRQLRSGYNIIRLKDKNSPYTVDFIIQQSAIRRRHKATFLGLPTYFVPPESLIVTKLRMIKATFPPERNYKDRADIEAILDNTKVNMRLIRLQARRDGTLEILNTISSSIA